MSDSVEPESVAPLTATQMLAELAEAEAEEAQDRADAECARAEAARLSAQESQAPLAQDTLTQARSRKPSAIVVGAAAVLTAAALTATGLMLWQHRGVAAHQAAETRFVEAARTGVTALLSIDHTTAKDDVRRILELSTGSFHDDFARRADDFIKTAVTANAVTKGSIRAAALESVEADAAVVLVAASSQVTNVNGAKEDPRPWRMSVTVTRDGDNVKMSDVEFVP